MPTGKRYTRATDRQLTNYFRVVSWLSNQDAKERCDWMTVTAIISKMLRYTCISDQLTLRKAPLVVRVLNLPVDLTTICTIEELAMRNNDPSSLHT